MSQWVSLLALYWDCVAPAVNAIPEESVTSGNTDLMPTTSCPSPSVPAGGGGRVHVDDNNGLIRAAILR